MGDYASRKKGTEPATVTGAPGMESFWAAVAKGATQSLVDPRAPGTAPDPSAMLPYIDRDHDDDPVAMANKVTAHLTRSAAAAKTLTRAKAQPYVDALIAAMDHTDEREGHHAMLNTLDRLDDPALRTAVLARFHAQTGRELSTVIETSTWYGARDKAQAQALISPARAKTEREIAELSPVERAKLQAEARKTATEIANVIGRESASDNAAALHRALAGKTPQQIEAIRAAVREQSRDHESLYEQIDRSSSGGNEDAAVASLSGDPVYAASVALQNAAGDAPRIVEILGALKSDQLASLKQRFPAATLVWMTVAPDQQTEIGALVNDKRDDANGAKIANLFRDGFHGVAMEGPGLDKQSQHNREVRTTANLMRELETMSPEKLANARREWDGAALQRGEKTWDTMIEERFGSGDPLTYLRIRALASGNKVEATALALTQGLRDHDQTTIDAALANPDLSSSDPTKRAAAREHARAVAERVQQIDANKQRAIAAMTGGDIASVRGDNLDTKLATHYAHQAATQHFESISDVNDFVVTPDEQAARRKKRAHAAEVGTDELREQGTFSTATEIHRARDQGDQARVATILENQRDRDAVGDVSWDYNEKYGEPLFQQLDPDQVDAYRDFQALYGNAVSHDDAVYSMRDSIENRVAAVHSEGPRAVRSNETQLGLDRREREHQKSDAVAGSQLFDQVVFGRAAGSEQRHEWAVAREETAVDGPQSDFDAAATHTRSMSDMQRDEKIAMAERATRWISIAGKLVALATLNPAAMAVIDTLVGFATIYVKGDIQGEAYKTVGADLLDTGITVLNDLAMIPIMKLESALARTAAMLGLSSGTIIVRNDRSGNSAATTIDLIKNVIAMIVFNTAGEKFEQLGGGGFVGQMLNGVTTTLGSLGMNGTDGAGGAAEELAGNLGGIGAKGRVHAPAHHATRAPARHDYTTSHTGDAGPSQDPHDAPRAHGANPPVDHSRHPDVIASGHHAEDSDDASHTTAAPRNHEPHRGDRTVTSPTQAVAKHPPQWHPDPARNAALEQHAKREGHSGVDLHNHFMGVVSVDDFAAEMGTTGPDKKKIPLTSEQMLLKVRDAVRGDTDYAAHYKIDDDGKQTFDHTGAGQGQRGGDAFNNVKAIEDAQAKIEEKRRGPQGPDTEAEIKRIADDAVNAALNAGKHTPFDGGYSIRDTLVKTYIDKQPDDGTKTPYSKYIRMTLNALERDGVLYSEQSQSVNKLAKGNITAEAVAKELADLNKDRAAKGLPPMDVRFLAMIETKFLGAEGADPATADAKWQEQLANLEKLMERGDIIGVDIASPETSDMTAGGAQMQHRMRDLALMLQAEGARAGRKLVLRPHVGEGYIEMPDNEHGHKAGFDADHSSEHYKKAEANLWAMVDAVERLSKTIGPDGKPIYNPADPNPEIRLGHATHATPELASKMKELGIVVEVNLGSNAVSGSLQDSQTNPQGRSDTGHLHYMDDHSLLVLAAEGVPVVLATDGQGVMNTQLRDEHRRAARLLFEFRGADGSSSKTMPVTREVYAEAKRTPIEQTSGPFVLTYGELPAAMKENLDTAYTRMMSEAAKRANVVAQDDVHDIRRAR